MCNIEQCLDELRFDVGNLDLGVPPRSSSEYDPNFYARVHHVRYNFSDHGNGIRLLMHFESEGDEQWNVIVRHGKRDRDEFFEPRSKEEEYDEG
ncbi:hypothetical protein AAVH_26306 [Aphelenchoides avenae]|nr:hypothetical protein AAVH_39984 [Aphelenchus avenae]KAH7706466.1 hypothetical protein AAVH_26306 [Aphelenchus avenae]